MRSSGGDDTTTGRREIPAPRTQAVGWPWDPAPLDRAHTPRKRFPLVSVVVPSFRQGTYIEATLRSVLLQDYPSIELLVIDGGSEDDTTEILQRYDALIRYWVSEPDRGQTHAINKGLARASGEIFTYLNSDDLLHPGAVRRIVDAFEENPDAAVIHGQCIYVDEQGVERFRQRAQVDGFGDYLRIWERFPTGNYITQPEAFIRRKALDSVGPFREELQSVMDFEMWLRLLVHGFVFQSIDHPIAHFRTYPSQKSSVDPGDELFAVIEEYLHHLPGGGAGADAQAVRKELGRARSSLLIRAAIAANILDRYPRALEYCMAAVRKHPGVLGSYAFWSVLAHPIKRLLPEGGRAAARRLLTAMR